jgi:hypothetical protein
MNFGLSPNEFWFEYNFIKKQTDEICKMAVQQYRYALQYVQNQTDEICKLAVQQNGYALYYIQNQTDVICNLAVPTIMADYNLLKTCNFNIIFNLSCEYVLYYRDSEIKRLISNTSHSTIYTI